MTKNIDCILTGRNVERELFENGVHYYLNIADKDVDIFFCEECMRKIKLNVPYYVVQGLIANGKWPVRSYILSAKHTGSFENVVSNSELIILENYLGTAVYPKSPSERMEHLFLNLFKLQKVDGETVRINLADEKFWASNYFQNADECLFYVEGLKEKGLIKYQSNGQGDYYGSFRITHLGLNKVVELLDEGDSSNNCFIAMAFNEEMKPYREAIKRALKSTGFNPIIIDEEHLNSDKTIPDGILAGIKKSKFCVADFTNHRNGVYFESGYALGLGKPVIYLCEEREFDKAHFDIKQLQHIIYSSAEELEKKLIQKIEAWIKE